MREMEPEATPSQVLPEDKEALRQALLSELASMESSDPSDEEVFQLRLSCILEDDESDTSVPVSKVPKTPQDLSSLQITDIDDVQNELPKTEEEEESYLGTRISRQESEDISGDEPTTNSEFGFEIKKLKSSDILFKKPVVVKRVEYSSDSSLDISEPSPVSLSKPGEFKVTEVTEEDDTLSLTPDNVFVEYDTSGDDLEKDKTEPTEKNLQDEENHITELTDTETNIQADTLQDRVQITQPTDTEVKVRENKRVPELPDADTKGQEDKMQVVEIIDTDTNSPEEKMQVLELEDRETNLPDHKMQEPELTNTYTNIREDQMLEDTVLEEPDVQEETIEPPELIDAELEMKDAHDISELEEELTESKDEEMVTLAPVFPKVPREYFQKVKDELMMEEEEEVPEVVVMEVDDESIGEGSLKSNLDKKKVSFKSQESIHSTDSSKPRVPPETYMWEDLRRLRVKGGYPWTYLDKPPFEEASWIKERDHEYEPINPPPPPILSERDKTSIPETERHFVRIPLDNELVVQGSVYEEEDVAMAEEPRTPEDMEVERIAAAQDLQDSLETRYLAATPTNTTASRTDCDVNTSMLDSSGLEDLPLNRGSRTKKAPMTKTEQMRAQAQGIHQKLRSQAGKLRSRLRSLPKPSFNLKEREKDKEKEKEKPRRDAPEKPRFRLPERPKFNLPERPKFKFPDRPKLSLPERPKFSLPERPKINLPDRPRFSLPDRSKFTLPQKAKLSLPSFSKSRTSRDGQQGSSNSAPRKNVFEFDFKTYPKMFNKKSKQKGDYTTSSPKQTRGNTPPPKMRTEESTSQVGQKEPMGQKWTRRFDDIQYADDEAANSEQLHEPSRDRESARSERSESISDFRDKELGYTEDIEGAHLPPGRRTISTKSSLSHLSDREVQSSASSEDRHRKGVLEEIDSDEFFLRQKGISQEDIDMGKYLSEEIREAFRSPVVNALSQMDYDYDDLDVENIEPATEPLKPSRTRSLRKKSTPSWTSENLPDDIEKFRTYPPRRPSRKSRSQSKSNLNEEGVTTLDAPPPEDLVPARSHRYENDVHQQNRYENYTYEEDNSEYYKSPGPATEYHHYKVPRSDAPVNPTPMKRKSSASGRKERKKDDGWVEVAIETSFEEIVDDKPQPLKRNKSKRSLQAKEEVEMQNRVAAVQSDPQPHENATSPPEPDYIIPADPEEEKPIAPKRMRSLSRGRSVHSLDDRAIKEDSSNHEKVEVSPPEATPRHEEVTPLKTHHYEVTGNDDVIPGYATVEKAATMDRPERAKKQKPPRPPPPRRRRATPSPTFNTLPATRSPIRPVRNYSTLGPSRPPRKPMKLSSSVEHIYADDRQSLAYAELTDDITQQDPADDSITTTLQTEEVIEKMKGRPLPPPPRPPRQKGKAPGDEFLDEAIDLTEEDKISMAVLRGEVYPLDKSIRQEVAAFIHEPPTTQGSVDEVVEEVCVSTQTDPLPEDYCVEGEEDIDMIHEFSHEQLQVQEAFLEEMRKEEERIQREMELKRRSKTEGEEGDMKITSEVIKQIDEILAEEKKLLLEQQAEEQRKQQEKRLAEEQMERDRQAAEARRQEHIQKEEERRRQREAEERRREDLKQKEDEARRAEEKKKGSSELEVADADMGYASLDRRQPTRSEEPEATTSSGAIARTQERPAPPPTYVPVLPDTNTAVQVLKTDKLQVQELDVGNLRVNQLRANTIHVDHLTGNRITVEDIQSRAGNLMLGNIELPPAFIEQILARIPWEQLRPAPITAPIQMGSIPHAPTPSSTPVDTIVPTFPASLRSLRRQPSDNSEEEESGRAMPRRPHRRLHTKQHIQCSSDEEDAEDRVLLPRRTLRSGSTPSIAELSQQLSRACTTAGLRAMRGFSARVRPMMQGAEASQQLKTILCVVLVMIAGFFLLTFDTKSVHHYHWDFQFPPQPPPTPPPEM